jgi:hypothetical protein
MKFFGLGLIFAAFASQGESIRVESHKPQYYISKSSLPDDVTSSIRRFLINEDRMAFEGCNVNNVRNILTT